MAPTAGPGAAPTAVPPARYGPPAGCRDSELVRAARQGDDAALHELLTTYRGFARTRARSYFVAGADHDDVVQEGMIGLYKAVRDFEPGHGASFRTFAELCITRQILTAVTSATRHKHGPLNHYVSFDRPAGDGGSPDTRLDAALAGCTPGDPADLVVAAERVRALQAHVDAVLSDLETEVLRLHVAGRTHSEIAQLLQRHVKSVDNALQRSKRKLEDHLQARVLVEAG